MGLPKRLKGDGLGKARFIKAGLHLNGENKCVIYRKIMIMDMSVRISWI